VLTALANDVGFELVFTRQLIAHAGPDDIAVGISTSGNSRNLLRALEHAARTGLLTLGFAGYDGGDMQRCGALDACFVVESDSVHRIQEVQAALAWRLWSEVQVCLDEDATGV
jgi:D-sedoheptulose 7-phosphate isomerase